MPDKPIGEIVEEMYKRYTPKPEPGDPAPATTEFDGQTLYAVPMSGCKGCVAYQSRSCEQLPACGSVKRKGPSIVWMTQDDMIQWTAQRLGEGEHHG